jgi:hypothetical protein
MKITFFENISKFWNWTLCGLIKLWSKIAGKLNNWLKNWRKVKMKIYKIKTFFLKWIAFDVLKSMYKIKWVWDFGNLNLKSNRSLKNCSGVWIQILNLDCFLNLNCKLFNLTFLYFLGRQKLSIFEKNFFI